MSSHTHSPSLLFAAAWMVGALTSFTVMAVAVRELAADLHAFEMLFIRSGIGLIILMVVLSAGGWGQVRTTRLVGHALRNVAHFTGQVLWIFGIALLPLATVFAIEFTSPMFAALLAVLFLGERFNRGRAVALLLGFGGILVILRPGAESFDEHVLLMVVCALFFGTSMAATKWLTSTESALTIVFYMTLMQTGFGLVASFFVWSPILAWHWPWLILLGITGLSAHYCMARALGHADTTIVTPMDFMRLPLIAVVGFLAYGEAFDWLTLAGAAVIFAGNYYSITQESRMKKEEG